MPTLSIVSEMAPYAVDTYLPARICGYGRLIVEIKQEGADPIIAELMIFSKIGKALTVYYLVKVYGYPKSSSEPFEAQLKLTFKAEKRAYEATLEV